MLSRIQELPNRGIYVAYSTQTAKKVSEAHIYQKTLSSGIEFDMIYSPGMWECLLEQTDEKVMYIHSGGVSGNESMLERYKQCHWMPLV